MSDQSTYSVSRLRSGLRYFLLGKGASALCGFALFVLVARLLSIPEYGVYVTLVAGIDLAVALSTVGVDWVTVRYLPEYRLSAGKRAFVRFLAGVAALRLLTLTILALALWVAMPVLLQYMHLGDYGVPARLCVLILVSEGMARFLRDHVLDSLLLQGRSQLSLLTRSVTILAVLGSENLTSGIVSLQTLVSIELGGSALGLTIAGVLLVRYLHADISGLEEKPVWNGPSISQMAKMAIHNYFSLVLSLLYGSQVLMLIASRELGVDRAAVFGFARNLSDQVRRYLPASLFVGLIRPVVIASFAQSRDFARLNQQASLIYKVSVFALCPVLLAVAVFGGGILDLLSNHKYGDAKAYVIALIAVLLPFSHRQVLEMVVNTLNQPALWSRAALSSLLILPLVITLLALDWGIWGLIAAVGTGEVISNIVLVRGLRKAGYPYQVDYSGLLRIGTAVGLAYAALFAFREAAPTVITLLAAVTGSLLGFLIAARLLRPFNAAERVMLGRIMPKWLLVW